MSAGGRAIHADDRERVLAEDLRAQETGEPFSSEYRMVRPDGRIVWLQDDAVLLRDGQGDPLYWQGVRFDVTDRKEAEMHLREAEQRYRTLVEQIPAITYIDESRGCNELGVWHTIYISPQVEHILGYTPAEWSDDDELWANIIHPDDRDIAIEANRAHYEHGEPLTMELRMIARDGTVHWIRDEAIMVNDDDGRPCGARASSLDITERKLGEQQLHEAEERYRSLIETIPAATYIDTVEAVSQAVYMSPQVADIFGYQPEEWLRSPELWEQGVEPEDLPAVAAKIERLNRDGTPYEAEYRFRRPDGRVVWVHDQAVVIRDEHGVPRFCQGVMFDITERREAEEQLREAEERFRAIVEHVPAGDLRGRARHQHADDRTSSPQVQAITGIPPEEWVGNADSWVDALHPEDREEVAADGTSPRIAAEEPWSDEYRMRTRDGRTIWVHDETTFIHDDEGRHAMLLGVMSDITERKLAEHALRESEQREREAAERLRALDEMKNTFLAAVSHELRSPLTAILGLALTLERSEMVEDDRNDLLERLAANARKLDRLLKDLLDIDRLNRGIVDPQYRVTDVGALARRTIESLDALADRSIMVFAEPRRDRRGSRQGRADRREPADERRAPHERRPHDLAAGAAGRRRRPDRGRGRRARRAGGAPRGDLRAVPSGARRPRPHSPGTGIGLSLVGRFAELHGGRAWVEEREGGGASFRVFLPGRDGAASGDAIDRTPEECVIRRTRGGRLDSDDRCRARTTTLASDACTSRSSRRAAVATATDTPAPDARKPPWLKVRLASGPNHAELTSIMRGLDLHTVCEEAMCPNIGECWEAREATFLILGDRCTRRCGFCDVMTARPDPVDEDEPARIASAVQQMGLRFVVLTGVARDDLPDGGARIWAATIRAVREAVPGCGVEVLPTDFKGGERDIATVIEAEPDVFAHNLETVRRLHGRIRPAFGYDRSLDVLRIAKRLRPGQITKSNLILGMGETTVGGRRGAAPTCATRGCDLVTMGQYLQPTKLHLPVDRWVTPDEFAEHKRVGEAMGIPHVEAGPLVRSSYHAGKQFQRASAALAGVH